jgi:AraC family transcriptional regulator
MESTVRVQDLSEVARLSTSYFSRAFKISTGKSMHEFIVRRRMERAQELMLTTNASLCQIALACGLCDQAHFSRLFRRVVGMSPSVWRRRWFQVRFDTAADRVGASALRRMAVAG